MWLCLFRFVGSWVCCAGCLMWMGLFLEFGLDLVYLWFVVAFGRFVLHVLDCGGWCCRGWLCSCLVCLCCGLGFVVVSVVVIVAIVSGWFWLVDIIDFVRLGIGLFVNSVVYILLIVFVVLMFVVFTCCFECFAAVF